ncbi:MAG: LacI family DNA-binding transcriptional regulator [Candidatus Omnitrophica bacterium]|nr:LacI family DNA-binding transcriptional regulator [Candidatus Omnitrophota bacterium]
MNTIKDVAKKAGVSPGTVSKALLDRHDVSNSTKRRVKRVAEEMGYIPNIIARSLVTSKTNTIGLVTPYLGNPALIERLRGVQNACLSNKYLLITCLNEGGAEEELSQAEALIARKVDGIIITPTGNSIKLKEFISRIEIPVVLMSEMIEGTGCDFVGEDDYEGAKTGMEHLISLGHRNIAYFGSFPEIYSDGRLAKGYRDTLEKYGIPYRKELVLWGNTDRDILEKNVERVMNTVSAPTAIFAWSDIIAIDIMSKLGKMNINVPEDVSIIGYDNIDFLSLFHIPLTTVAQPNFLIGQKTVELLLECIERDGENEPTGKLIFRPELIVRKSTGPAKK